MTPKPNYYALKNLTATLSDPGPSFSPASFTYGLQGGNASLHHLLLQKRNGMLYLFLWVEGEAYNVNTLQYETVAPENITLSIGTPIKTITSETFNDDGSVTQGTLPVTPTLALSISDHVQVIILTTK